MRRFLTHQRAVMLGICLVFVAALAVEHEAHSTGDEPAAPVRAQASLTAADVDRIAARVERLRGLRFKRPVKPLFVNRDRATALVEQANRRDYAQRQRRIDEQELKLIGLLDAGESMEDVDRVIEGEQILGFYDPKTRRLVVIRDPSASKALLEMTLSHELTHALEDQHFGLQSPAHPNDDGAIAYSALAEGSATEVMTNYAERYLDPRELLTAALGASGSTKLPAYVEDALLFPYEQGQSFVQTFRGERTAGGRGSWGAFDSVMAGKRAESTEQVLHPRRFALGDRPRPVTMPNVATAAAGWKRLNSASVGEFDLSELFKIAGGRPAPAAAEGWGGGRFDLWRRGGDLDCEGACVDDSVGVLRIVWDTPGDRAEAESSLRKAIEGKTQGKKLPKAADAELWSSRGGAIGMRSAGKTTTIVFAPDTKLAVRVLSKEG
jgi:hypothetical protein